MKIIKTAAIAALLTSTMVAPPLITPALAAAPSQADMEAVCAQYAGSGLLVETVSTGTSAGDEAWDTSSIQEVAGSRTFDPTSDFTPAGVLTLTGPIGRIGQSPNLFQAGEYSQAQYSRSLIDQEAQKFESTDYNFDCNVYTAVWDNPGNGNCVGDPSDDVIDGTGPGSWHPDNDHNACVLITTLQNTYHESINDVGTTHVNGGEYFLYAEDVVINEPFLVGDGPYPAGAFVVCISPARTGPRGAPGTWSPQNGYSGTNCNTTYFNSASWLAGVEDLFHAIPTLPAV